MIDLDTTVVTTSDLTVADLGDEKVALNAESGQYYSLNGVGAHIFGLLEEPRKVSDLLLLLQAEYDVEPEQLKSEVLSFLENMQEHQMVRINEAVSA